MDKKILLIGGGKPNEITGVSFESIQLYNQLPKTWERKISALVERVENKDLDGVILYLATPLFLQASRKLYFPIFKKLLNILNGVNSLILIYEQNIHGRFDYYDYEGGRYVNEEELRSWITELEGDITKNEIIANSYRNLDLEPDEVIAKIRVGEIKMPFDNEYLLNKLYMALDRIEEGREREVEIADFIDEILSLNSKIWTFVDKKSKNSLIEVFTSEVLNDVFFSIYVSDSQFLSDEFEEFLKIFEKYLQKIKGINFSVDVLDSINGRKFNFKSKDKGIDIDIFQNDIHAFGEFMDLCIENPDLANEILDSKFKNNNEVKELINFFSKKYKRLSLDIKHQKERLKLSLNQEFENSIMELDIQSNPAYLIGGSNIIVESFKDYKLESNSNLKFNLHFKYSEEEERIFQIALKYGEERDLMEVKSNVEILKDQDIPKREKISAKEKLKAFLIKAGRKSFKHAEDIGVKLLTKYLETISQGV